ncbi:MAG: hypothetical protein ACR2LM_13545 [Pyrinomonadaceae bacterium]
MNPLIGRTFAIYIFAFAFFLASRPISDADFWFHLKTGEYIIQTGLIPRTDTFSFTNYGTPWIAHGWLSGVIFYAVYSRLGFKALIFIFAILTALAFWIVFKRSNSHPFIAGFATLLGVWTVLPTIGVRPRVFTLLLASVYLAILTRYARRGEGREIWWLVPLMVLWVNLHGGFLIGLALIGLTMVGIPLDTWAAGEKVRASWPRLRTLGLVLVGCLLAGLANPYGTGIYAETIRTLISPVYQQLVVDWLSPNFHQPELRPLTFLILLTIGAIALSPKRVRPGELLLFLAALYSTLQTQRNMALLALVAVPIFANYFQDWLDSTSFGRSFGKSFSKPQPSRYSTWITALSLVLLLPLLVFALRLRSTVYSSPTQRMLDVPLKAVQYLKERQISGNTFTNPNIWGGYLIWALPSNPVYIDGRGVFPEEFVKEYVEIMQGTADWRVPFERYGVKIVLIKPGSLLARQLAESSEWERVYDDEMSVVFRRR